MTQIESEGDERQFLFRSFNICYVPQQKNWLGGEGSESPTDARKIILFVLDFDDEWQIERTEIKTRRKKN